MKNKSINSEGSLRVQWVITTPKSTCFYYSPLDVGVGAVWNDRTGIIRSWPVSVTAAHQSHARIL